MLEKYGYTVALSSNGQEAVDQTQREPFDLVLMDLQMPVMDGIEATLLIRQSDKLMPIFALTARGEITDRQKCFDAGMNEFLTKPVEMKQLLDAIQTYLPA